MSAVELLAPAPEALSLLALLHGRAPLARIVAVEPAGGDAVTLYRRLDDGTVAERDTFRPWLLLNGQGVSALPAGERSVTPLRSTGTDAAGQLDTLVEFEKWGAYQAAQSALSAAGVPSFSYASVVGQYLIASGRTLFHDMRFEDLHRAQLDVETASLRASAADASILIAALTDNRGHEEVFSAAEGGEAELLRRLTARIAELDPDVIEGHNVIDFDLPYVAARAESLGVPLTWGRSGQRMWLQEKQGRLKVGARLLPSVRVHLHGRHILDTYQQIQRFDAEGKLESYALKPVMDSLGLVREGREFVDRTDIGGIWERDPQRLAAYCLDDARDVRTLAELVTPTDFYQTQIVPRTYQDVATGGTGEKINSLMVRAYVASAHAVPQPEPPRPYPGGYLELRTPGVFRRVVKCDVESLYPAVMLRYGVKPRSDTLNVFLPLLDDLTRRRLDAKHRIRSSAGGESAYWTGLSGSYKVLINSFYGYLGYARANFNDYDAAELVTTTGQKLIKEVLTALEERRCEIIEVDTDGVYFVAPPGVDDEASETALIEEVGRVLPAGINLAHDGRYVGMVALKQKTYFLLTHDGKLVAKGSSLRSRRDERFARRFVQEAAVMLIERTIEDVSALYLSIAKRIQAGDLPLDEFARRESITNKTFTSPGLKRLASAAKGTAVGQQVRVYQRADGSLALTSEFKGDEDREYLLRRLHDMAKRFEVLCSSKGEFDRLFPKLRPNSDADAPRPMQLSLFG
ncbi:MAG TPA: 3'-5' exonuclease [Chloroflexota bacterium]|nr:3'-5' exonuclease [Chloroflexota bacterium]